MKRQPRLDHIVIAAASLKEGVAYVKRELGVDMPFGGEHVKMGTHNHLMQLGNDVFLEVITINENAAPPGRPRWYGLDDPYTRGCLVNQPAVLAWVINTDDLASLMQSASYSQGNSELVTRGDLSWLFGLPEDGRLLAGGMLPYAIEWHVDKHPSGKMADLNCRLERLEIFHPYPEWIESALQSINALELVRVKAIPANDSPFLSAVIKTPNGKVQLQSHRPKNTIHT